MDRAPPFAVFQKLKKDCKNGKKFNEKSFSNWEKFAEFGCYTASERRGAA